MSWQSVTCFWCLCVCLLVSLVTIFKSRKVNACSQEMWLVSLFEQQLFIQIHKTFNPSFSFPQPRDISWGFTLWILITWFFFVEKNSHSYKECLSPLRTKNSNQGWIYISSIYHHEHFTASSFVLIEWKNTFSWLCTHRKIVAFLL